MQKNPEDDTTEILEEQEELIRETDPIPSTENKTGKEKPSMDEGTTEIENYQALLRSRSTTNNHTADADHDKPNNFEDKRDATYLKTLQ